MNEEYDVAAKNDDDDGHKEREIVCVCEVGGVRKKIRWYMAD